MNTVKKGDGAPAPPPADPDSLDFSEIGPSKVRVASPRTPKPGRKRASVVPLRKVTSSGQDKPAGFRRIALPLLIAIAIAGAVAFVTSERSSKEAVTATPPAIPPAPASKSAAAQPPAPVIPSPKADTPPPKAATAPDGPPRIPAEFLNAYQEYAARSGNKAIAMALDTNGRWAYGSIAGYSTQSEANEEALSECRRFKTQSGIQADCRLYATGDKVVW